MCPGSGTASRGKLTPLKGWVSALYRYEVVVLATVIEELQEIASYSDAYGQAASTVLNRADTFETRTVDLDVGFPLDDGEKQR